MNETTNAASTQPDRRGADLLTAIDELKEAAGTLAFKLGETEHAEYAFQLAQGLFEVWQELWGAAHPAQSDDDTVTLSFDRGSPEYLLARALGCGERTATEPTSYDVLSESALTVTEELEAVADRFAHGKQSEMWCTLSAMAERLRCAQQYAQNLHEHEHREEAEALQVERSQQGGESRKRPTISDFATEHGEPEGGAE